MDLEWLFFLTSMLLLQGDETNYKYKLVTKSKSTSDFLDDFRSSYEILVCCQSEDSHAHWMNIYVAQIM